MEDEAGEHHRSRRDAGGGDREKDRHSRRDDGGGDREKDRHSRRDEGGGDREKDRHSRRNDDDVEKDRHSRRDDGDREKERHFRRDDDGGDREKDRRSRREGEKDRRSRRESEREKDRESRRGDGEKDRESRGGDGEKDRESRRGDGEREIDTESRRDESKKKQKDRELRSGNGEKDRESQHGDGEKDLELKQDNSEKEKDREKDREFSRRDNDKENDQELRRGDVEKDQGLMLDDAEREKDPEPRCSGREKEKDRESRRDNSKKEKEKDRESRRDNSRKEKEEGRESRRVDSEKETNQELRPDDAEREKDRELMCGDGEMEEQEVKCGDVEKRKERELRHDNGEREKEKDWESKHADGVMEKKKYRDSRRGDQEKERRRKLERERNNEDRLKRRKEREMSIEEKPERRKEMEVCIEEKTERKEMEVRIEEKPYRRKEMEKSIEARHGRRKEREMSSEEMSDRRTEREKSIEERPGRRKEREMSSEERSERRKEREKSIEERPERRKERDMGSEERHGRERERRKEKEMEREKARERDREERRVREWEERDRRAREERDKRRRNMDGDRDNEERDRKRRREDSREQAVERRDMAVSEESRRKKDEAEAENAQEVDPEEEQRRLDEEMEKRRRRVQEWQELRKKNLEEEKEKSGVANGDEQPEEPGKKWTLEGESDDEEPARENGDEAEVAGENRSTMDVDGGDGKVASDDNEVEIDPLDAFMNALELPEDVPMTNVLGNLADGGKSVSSKDGLANGDSLKKGKNAGMGRIIPGEESASDYSDIEDEGVAIEDEDDDEFMKRVKKSKVEKLSIVDHSKIQYPPFKKNFYIEVKEIARMTVDEVAAYRKQLELKMHGKDVPKPVKTWNQTGLNSKILDMIKKLNFEKPMPIQAQALPIIMSGRDCIGIAKTGSGKTLAFVLPMLRHIKDQPPVVPGDGPVGLIMAPTRELVQQIHSDIKKFAKVVGLNCVPVYGGSGVAQQISELKRGAEIVVCTPGRMIDILCTSSGKITNLRRVTYLVMDEADRMFDMGFEPQITRIVQNTRPDRQTVLFSATFPRQVEILARKVLNKPVEIQVGGRSVVNTDITQLVEVRQETDRFWRLLELLGEWYEKGKILVFVHSQEKCDSLFRDLIKHGYPCLSLHGAKDQTDRESTISDFKSNVCNLMIATSVAARGLDVKELELVVNFDVPNHYEDYVHRVGRTGRAGRKGCAITFISEDDARYAPDLVKALELSEQAVPQDLKALADGFMAKVNQGTERAHGTGYGGSGFKFNEEEDEARKAAKKAQAREYGFEEDKSDSDSEDDGVQKAGADLSQATVLAQALAAASKAVANSTAAHNGGLNALAIPGLTGLPNTGETAAAAAIAAALNLRHNLAKIQADAMPEHYHAELDINDFPQNARWRVTHKETLGPISDFTGAAITTRGTYCPPGKVATSERKLYLYIEGPTESSVKKAKAMLKQVLEDCTQLSSNLSSGAQPGKYSLL